MSKIGQVFAFLVLAQQTLGVGVGLGTITVDQTLTPGGVYKLPDLPIVNTGNQAAEFQASVSLPAEYLEKLPLLERKRQELWLKKWVWFNPARAYLKPSQSQSVGVSLVLPLTAPKGDYLFYLEASPIIKKPEGNVSIGPAAATKLFFRVGNSPGVLGAFRQRASTLWHFYQPWSTIFIIGTDLTAVALLARTLLSVSIQIRAKRRD